MPNRIKKKICTKFWFMVVDFPQIPIARSGILKIPSGSTPCPRGFSKSPPGSGDLDENPLPKTRIFYINFVKFQQKFHLKFLFYSVYIQIYSPVL